MHEKKAVIVEWTEQSLDTAIRIKKYLERSFSEKEIETFLTLLSTFENAVAVFPKLYPVTLKKKNIRRAVLSKELSVYYRFYKKRVEVLAVLDNRCDISDWIG